MDAVYLNGDFVPGAEAKVSVFDQGFLYGDGIYESFRSIGENLYQFAHHFRRLCQSAEALGYLLPYSQEELEMVLYELRRRNNLNHAYYRITITRGTGEIGFQRHISHDLTWLIIAREFQGFAEHYYQQGIELHLARTRRNAPEAINPKIKSISNLNSLLGKLEARQAGVLEVLMLNNKEQICEGSASNIFWVKEGCVYTPSATTGLLEGVTRSTLVRLCQTQLNLPVVSGEYGLSVFEDCGEVFIASTSLEVMPVIKVGKYKINQGQVGPVAQQLRMALHQDMGLVA